MHFNVIVRVFCRNRLCKDVLDSQLCFNQCNDKASPSDLILSDILTIHFMLHHLILLDIKASSEFCSVFVWQRVTCQWVYRGQHVVTVECFWSKPFNGFPWHRLHGHVYLHLFQFILHFIFRLKLNWKLPTYIFLLKYLILLNLIYLFLWNIWKSSDIIHIKYRKEHNILFL